MKSKLELAKEKVQDAQSVLWALEKEDERKKAVKLRADIGKCFVYQNSYSEFEKWPLYGKIISVNDDATYGMLKIQKDTVGRIEIEGCARTMSLNGYKPISLREYTVAVQEILNEVNLLFT
jgi:hypothetical protein